MNYQLPTVLYGGDYNPEQWPEDSWEKDMQLFKKAHLNSATINVFSWAKLEPQEGKFDFSELDRIVEILSKNNMQIVMGTSTAAIPAWMFKKYPDVARVDYHGRRHVFGGRENFCPSSPNFSRLASELVTQLAKRYANNPHIVAWHISNEYGGNCYCQNCEATFRKWLKDKYHTLDALNNAWNANFWSHTIYDWDEIVAPTDLGDAYGPEGTNNFNNGLGLDYLRFQSDAMLSEYLMERRIIKKFNAAVPVLTNFWELPNRTTDYMKWAKYQDIIAYDNYPRTNTTWDQIAFFSDMMRSLKDGQPYMLIESTPNQTNWQSYNPIKRPGEMRAISYQSIAHGADTVQFFQLKQSLGAGEKFHGAVIPHSQRTDTRMFREITQLGVELQHIGHTFKGSRTSAKVGLIFDWPTYWTFTLKSGPTKYLQYVSEIQHYYKQLYKQHISVDIIGTDSDFSKYQLLIAPTMYMVKKGVADKISDFVHDGGTFVTTSLSGIVNGNDIVYPGGYPGPLRQVTGMWVEETDTLAPGDQNLIEFADGQTEKGKLIADLIRLDSAKPIAVYKSNFYQGMPAITKNHYGQGICYYVGTKLTDSGMQKLFYDIISTSGVKPIVKSPSDLEITLREKSGRKLYFVLNMTGKSQYLPIELYENHTDILTGQLPKRQLDPWDVEIISEGDLKN